MEWSCFAALGAHPSVQSHWASWQSPQSCLRWASPPGLQPMSGWLAPAEHTLAVLQQQQHTHTHTQLFSLPRCVFTIIYVCVNRPRHAATLKVNKQITDRNHKESSFPLFRLSDAKQTVCVGGESNYTYMKSCWLSIVSYRSAAPPVSCTWQRELKTLLTYWCFSLCRRKWRGIIATAITAEDKQFPRWRGKTTLPTVTWKKSSCVVDSVYNDGVL